jgi:hypothetical protein
MFMTRTYPMFMPLSAQTLDGALARRLPNIQTGTNLTGRFVSGSTGATPPYAHWLLTSGKRYADSLDLQGLNRWVARWIPTRVPKGFRSCRK